MIYCFECKKHGEFDVNLQEPSQEYDCPVCGKKSKRKWVVSFEGHYDMQHWCKDDRKSRESITDLAEDAPGYDDIVI